MADVGARLREARERKGIPLKQIAAATKISLHSLEALERNDVARLPGGIFSRAFVRSYAVEVGLDPDEILAEFLSQVGHHSPVALGVADAAGVPRGAGLTPVTRTAGSDEAAFESQQRAAAVVLKLVLISLAVGGTMLFFNLRGRAPDVAVPGGPPPGMGVPADAQAPPDAREIGGPPAGAAIPAGEPPAADLGAAGPDLLATQPPTPGLSTAEPVRLEIGPTRECWVRLTADGEVVLSRVLAPGEREAHTFQASAVLQVGDAEACALSINGRPARALGQARQVRQVVLTRDNYREFLQ